MKNYEQSCKEYSDIYMHLPVLKQYAEDCETIIEFGLGKTANAITAFLAAKPRKVISYDIDSMPDVVKEVQEYADYLKVEWEFRNESTTKTVIEKVDFLFIDAEHSYQAVAKELQNHHRVNKYIGFHDVISYASRNENSKDNNIGLIEGIVPAIFEFLCANPHWVVDYYSPFNNGLLILKRI